ncbi:hypothetical protein, partial [Roseomonas harenae]|uniref:hypothetical protein n=1 Tax=Muricoccus harenae TaxID=2692566 RepID=UPI001F30B786
LLIGRWIKKSVHQVLVFGWSRPLSVKYFELCDTTALSPQAERSGSADRIEDSARFGTGRGPVLPDSLTFYAQMPDLRPRRSHAI